MMMSSAIAALISSFGKVVQVEHDLLFQQVAKGHRRGVIAREQAEIEQRIDAVEQRLRLLVLAQIFDDVAKARRGDLAGAIPVLQVDPAILEALPQRVFQLRLLLRAQAEHPLENLRDGVDVADRLDLALPPAPDAAD